MHARHLIAADPLHRFANYFQILWRPETRMYEDHRASPLLPRRGRSQCDGCFGGEQQEGKGLLQVEADQGVGVAEIADRSILANVQLEVAATGSHDDRTRDRRGPNDLAVHQPLDVLQDGIPVITRLGQRRIGVGAKQHCVGAI
jgi:hypothetical protein